MKRLAAFRAALLCAVLTASCQGTTTPTQPTQAVGQPSAAAAAYLNDIVERMRVGSINRLTIDWTAFRNEVFAAAGGAQTIAELNPAIRTAITLLRDGHSSLPIRDRDEHLRGHAIVRTSGARRDCRLPPTSVSFASPRSAVRARWPRPLRARFRTPLPQPIGTTLSVGSLTYGATAAATCGR